MSRIAVRWSFLVVGVALAACDTVDVPAGSASDAVPSARNRQTAMRPAVALRPVGAWRDGVSRDGIAGLGGARVDARLASVRLPRLADGLATLFDAWGEPLAPDSLARVAASRNLRLDGGRVQVVAHLAAAVAAERGDVLTLGGVPFTVDGVDGRRVQGWTLLADLPALSRDASVVAVTAPVRPRTTVVSEGVAKMNVPVAHNLGVRGQGRKVGILDVGFQGYTSLLGTELPAGVVTQSFYGTGDITGGGETHGTAVAEVVYDFAPEAALYLVNYDSEVTFKNAVDWLIAQDVDVITTSTGTYAWENTDGTGPVAAKADAARDAGIVFTAAAGNSGDSHYRATFRPSEVPEFHEFYTTGDLAGLNILILAEDGTNIYGIPDGTPILVDLVWDDWGANDGTPSSTVDYDLYLLIFDEETDPANPGWALIASSEDVQAGAAFPRESIGVYTPETSAGAAIYGLVVLKKSAAAPSVPFDLFVMNVFSDLNLFGPDILTPGQSVITPCVGAKVQCIGAVDVNDALLPYSSRGPSHPAPGGATIPKPDFVATSEVSTVTYPKNASNPAGFGGTSGAAPHAAGIAALFLQLAGGDPAVAELQMRSAAVDLGPAGRDDTYGSGRLKAVPCWAALCDDGKSCTTDTCHPTQGCQHVASGVGCSIGGACVAHGAPNPVNACQQCDQASPTQWTSVQDGTACASDGNDCTLDQCQAGVCAHPTAPNSTPCADDGHACTSDLCQSGACAHAVTAGCLIDGACRAAGSPNPDNPCQQCAPANKTQWTDKADSSPCEDGLFCTTGDACEDGLCQSGLPRDCDAFADDCNTATCIEDVRSCVTTPLGDLTPCTDDGDACTLDRCETGACLHPYVAGDCGARECGLSPSGCHQCGTCPDGYGCGADGQCSDLCLGVVCPECQACEGGTCVAANEGAACAGDGNACTRDACAAGTCAHPAVDDGVPCSDGSACTRSDACQGGVCTGAEPVVCVALDACHVAGSCDPATGTCSNPAADDWTPCADDGNACTADACVAGACAHPAVDDGTECDDGDLCTRIDACVAGACTGTDPVVCPDPAECRSRGTCDAATGVCSDPAEADGVPCADDGNACTADSCRDGACAHVAREDDTPCADDGLSCTLDACRSGACAHVRQSGCILGGACVADGASDPLEPCRVCRESNPSEWSLEADDTPCDDGLFCTVADRCATGACTGGGPRDCADLDGACATGTCSEDDDACVATPVQDGTPCGDAYACAEGLLVKADACLAGTCADAGTVDCSPYAGCAAQDTCATSCASGADCVAGHRCVGTACVDNRAPVADAGEDAEVDEGAVVTLDGGGSTDLDGDPLVHAWTQEGEPAVALDDPAAVAPTFTAPEVDQDTVLVFRLVVSDGLAASPADEVRITIRDVPKPPEGEDVAGPDATGGDVVDEDTATVTDPGGEDTATATDPGGLDTGRDPGADTAGTDTTTTDLAVDVAGADAGTGAKGGGGCAAGAGTPAAPLVPMLLALAAFAARRRRSA